MAGISHLFLNSIFIFSVIIILFFSFIYFILSLLLMFVLEER